MCGIVGIIERKHNLFSSDLKVFETLLLVDSLRGEDSTGAFTVYGKSGSAAYTKQATNPINLFKTDEWGKFKSKAMKSGALLVGHNRKATIGEIKTANAHPFVVGNTILVHNGGITNWRSFDSTRTVDSHAVCSAIDRDGYKAVLPELEGAYTLVWYNVKTKQLHFARNEERPLVFMETEHYQAFASEKVFLEFAMIKAGQKINESFELATHTVSTYDIASHGWDNTAYKPKPKYYSVTTYHSYPTQAHRAPWITDDDLNDTTTTTTSHTSTTKPTQTTTSPTTTKSNDLEGVTIEKEMVIFFKVESHKSDTTNGRVKVHGKCISPDLEHCDIIHMMATTDLRVAEKVMPVGSIHQGKVSGVVKPICGLSAWVTDVKDPATIKDYSKTIEFPLNAIHYLLLAGKGKCSYCDHNDITIEDIPFCRIDYEVHNGKNLWTIECPNCVHSTLTGDERAEFEKAYPRTLQTWESFCESAGASPI